MLTNTLEEQMTNDKISWNFFLSDISYAGFHDFSILPEKETASLPSSNPSKQICSTVQDTCRKKRQLWFEGRVQIFTFSSVDESISTSLSRMAS